MKSRSALHAFLFGCSSLLAISDVHAASLYWDGTDSTANADGGAGTWDTTATNWDSSAFGGSSATWNNTTPDSAVFSGTAGTVTFGEAITVGGLRFDTNGYTMNSGASGLSFGAADNTILLAGNANATITGTVGGTGNIILGPLPALGRTLTLSGTSAGGWAGLTTVNMGSTLALSANNQGLLSTSGIVVNGGGITLTNTGTEAALDRVSDTAPITANGGTLICANPSDANTYAEALGGVALAVGQTGFSLATNQLGGGSQTLTLAGLTRSGATNTSNVVFSAAGGLNATTNKIVVTGAAEITAGEIVGPWATTGSAANIQTDYAVFDAAAQVLPANVAASTEDTWASAANAYTTSGAAVALTGNRTMSALRNTGTTATITLSDGASGFNLATNGILNAVNSQLTIAPGSVAGAITAPGTSGGHIYINTGGSRAFALTTNNNTINNNLSIDISAPIIDNGGPVTLVKTGDTSVLRLTGTNTYSGGTVINAGILLVGADSALGASSGSITLNGGQLRFSVNSLTVSRDLIVGPAGGSYAGIGNGTNLNFEGKLTGSGTLNIVDTAGAGGRNVHFNSPANDFTGAILVPSNSSKVRVNSLTDSSGAGDIIFYKGASANECTFEYGSGAIAPLTLSSRSIQIINNTGTTFSNAILLNSNASQPITVSTDLISIGSTARTLTLNAVAGPANAIAGKLSDGTGGGMLNLAKAGAGSWALSGANSHTGVTTISAGTLVVNGIANGGAASSSGASSSQSGSLVLAGGTLKFEPIAGVGGTGATTDRNFVIRSSSTLDASGAGALVFGQNGTVSPDVTDLTGTFIASNATVTGLSSTASLAVGMTVTSGAFTGTKTISAIISATSINLNNTTGIAAGSFGITAGIPAARTLTLTGTNPDTNTIAGVLQNSTAAGAGVLSVTKSGTGKWVLSGANTYTGATTVGAGTLLINGDQSLATGNVNVNADATLGGSGTLGGSVTVAAAANLAPGASAGTLGIGGDLDIAAPAAGAGTLNFGLGPIAASDKITVTGTLSIGTDALGLSDFNFTNLGGLQNGNYTLISSGTLSGTLDPADVNGTLGSATIQLQTSGNNIILAVSGLGVSSPYETWATGGEPFGGDANGDGVSNGLAFLLGAASPTSAVTLPITSQSGGGLVLNFKCLPDASSGSAMLYVEHSSDLGVGDAWRASEAVTDTPGATPANGVTLVVTPGSPLNSVTATISSSEATAGKLFGRLKVAATP